MPNENRNNESLPASDIELRSEQVQEILTKVPHWMIRWGNLVILILLLVLLLFSYFIKYPDINTAKITETANIQSGISTGIIIGMRRPVTRYPSFT